ncbi:P-loop NTPase fold protein [Aeromonas hydrophila]|uniref:P-loop NTPase fold protein n=1 Tax=Aeromonas hydrophila TaxID=644 RepID=UPI00398A17D4
MSDVNYQKNFINRYFDLLLYTLITWLIILFVSSVYLSQETISKYVLYYNNLPLSLQYLTFLISGIATKNILINCGDYNPRHEFHNEHAYITCRGTINKIGAYDLKLKIKQKFYNPPLRLTIVLFISIALFSYDVTLNLIISPEAFIYLGGVLLPGFTSSIFLIKPKNKDKDKDKDKDIPWYQNENPINNLTQDRLNRKPLVQRLYDIVTSEEYQDMRGIALIGPFGTGKSSVIGMMISKLFENRLNYLVCKIDTWGAYNSEDQIQKYFIEKIINSLNTITSTTSLNGLPSKYIHSLKGVQSFWLDTIPLFDNYSSPNNQLNRINDILYRLDCTILIVIEDIDRNVNGEEILNKIAPLFDFLNSCEHFRLIMSFGEKLNNPSIINRIFRHLEFVSFDKGSIYSSIRESFDKLTKEANNNYIGEYQFFFEDNDAYINSVREYLFEYIETPRDLKMILVQVEHDWKNYLHGCCDILDLLVISVLCQSELNLIVELQKLHHKKHTYDIIAHLSGNDIKGTFKKPENAIAIINFLFGNKYKIDQATPNRLQSCFYDHKMYLKTILSRCTPEDNTYILEQRYFSDLTLLAEHCGSQEYRHEQVVPILERLIKYRGIYDFSRDNLIQNKDNSLIALLSLYMFNISDNNMNNSLFEKSTASNLSTAATLITNISHELAALNLNSLKYFYDGISGIVSRDMIKCIETATIMNYFEQQNPSSENINASLYHMVCAILEYITEDSHSYIIETWLKNHNTEFSKKLFAFINS